MSKKTDYLVIGAGASGMFATHALAKSGKQVTVVSKQIGGAYGADGRITFYLLNQLASMFEDYNIVQSTFIENEHEKGEPDMKRIKKYVDSHINKVIKVLEDEIEADNVEHIDGVASFISENEVKVVAQDGSEEIYKFKKCLIATGAEFIKTPLLTGKKVLDIRNITSLESMPSSITIIGGGLTGTDMAIMFSKFGVQTTIVEKEDRILKSLDPQISKKYDDLLSKYDIKVYTNHEPTKIERIGQKCVILFEDDKLESEELMVCIGRKPCVQDLDVEKAGVVLTEDGHISFSHDLMTDNENIFVAGDVTQVEMNVGWAYHSALVATQNMLGSSNNYDHILFNHSTSADSNLVSIGLSEEAAKEEGYDIGVLKFTGSNAFRLMYATDVNVYIKAVYNKEDKTFLGFQILGGNAGEFAAVCSFILQQKATADTLSSFISTVPLLNEFFREMLVKIK